MSVVPDHVQRLLVRLEYVAMIAKGAKPNLQDFTFANSLSWVDSARRYLTGENRKDLLDWLQRLLKETETEIREAKDPNTRALLVDRLERAKFGVLNLTSTYKNSPDMLTHLRVLLDMIDLELGRHEPLDIKIV